MWRAVAAAGIVLSVATGAAACQKVPETPPEPKPVQVQTGPNDLREVHILMSDGRTVTCLTWFDSMNGKYGRALTCDWDHAEGTE